MLKLSRYLVAFAPVCLVLVAAGPVRAETVSRTVGYADLDLSSQSGQQKLSRRIARVVGEICGNPRDAINPADLHGIKKCRKEAWSSTHSQFAMAVARAQSRGTQLASR